MTFRGYCWQTNFSHTLITESGLYVVFWVRLKKTARTVCRSLFFQQHAQWSAAAEEDDSCNYSSAGHQNRTFQAAEKSFVTDSQRQILLQVLTIIHHKLVPLSGSRKPLQAAAFLSN
ncbi:hypothetical protein L596_004523 [Steinernema carpocapsae]|uniref:Uncharacterized protein n=1 Tax=Steinernema carpocapsae TaxID=34508 RepID=A0A4U8UXN9_STECR|nr:hypothetical protein L596_004523 [Steinernema carpocapsae]